MDSVFELSRRVGFDHPEEIVKTLRMGKVTCDVDVGGLVGSPALPPLSYTDDCMRFLAILRYWRGKFVAKECARAYRRIIRRDAREREEFWWSVQELLYRAKAGIGVVRKYLRRFRREYEKIMRARKRIEEITSVWILPPYVGLISGLLPPRMATRIVRFAIDSLIQKSDYFARFGVSTFDLVFGMFESLYRIALKDIPPREKLEEMENFVRFYLGVVEIALIGGENPVNPLLDLDLWKDAD